MRQHVSLRRWAESCPFIRGGPLGRCRWFCDGVWRRGTVKFWNEPKGFGVIDAGSSVKLLFHRRHVRDGVELVDGQQVSYERSWNARKERYWVVGVDAVHDVSDAVRSAEDLPTVSSASGHCDVSDAAVDTAGAGMRQAVDEMRQSASGSLPTSTAKQHDETAIQDGTESQRLQQKMVPAFDHPMLPQIESLVLEPMQLPKNISAEEQLELMAEQMERLRLQTMQNQQIILQGMYAMMQQQMVQQANMERALVAIAERLGNPLPEKASSVWGSVQSKLPALAMEEVSLNASTLEKDVQTGPVETCEALSEDQQLKPLPVKPLEKLSDQMSNVMHAESADKMDFASEVDRKQLSLKNGSSEESSDATLRESVSLDNHITEHTKPRASSDEPVGVADGQKQDTDSNVRPSGQSGAPAHWKAMSFHMVGSFSGWTINDNPMRPQGSGAVRCGRIVVRRGAPKTGSGDSRREMFQLVGDRSWDKRVFPLGDGEDDVLLRPAEPIVAAEDDGQGTGHGRNFAVEGMPGTAFSILYDLDARVVTCRIA